jgi:redox-sensitive bicupin YhaK (pirin superfamily)
VTVRIVPGEIAAKDTTARVVLPTVALPRFAPYERVAETIARSARRLPLHKHQASEVLTYVIEGSGTYEVADAPPESIAPGAARMLTAPSNGSHAINSGEGQTIRYFAVVAALPAGGAGATKVQSAQVRESPPQPDGSAVARVAGPNGPLKSAAGLECDAVRFVEDGTSFRRVGHDHTLICYALSGRGHVDSDSLEVGEAAVVTDASGIGLQGQAGFRAILVRAPRMTASAKPTGSGV